MLIIGFVRTLLVYDRLVYQHTHVDIWGDTAQEVELSSGSRRVAGSIPP